MRVARGLDMEGQRVGAGADERVHLGQRVIDHQVDVPDEAVGQRADQRRRPRDRRAEAAVHDVHVKPADPGSAEGLDLLTDAQRIRGVDANAEGHAIAASCASAANSSYASAGRAFSCTTRPTAWIIAAGAWLWKMFRPMSTPAAPSCMAR